jgi:hypothetical protein
MLKKIISGGHPGAEKAALDVALKLDIPHSGWAYKGRKTEEGLLPEKYKLKEIFDRSFENRINKKGIRGRRYRGVYSWQTHHRAEDS